MAVIITAKRTKIVITKVQFPLQFSYEARSRDTAPPNAKDEYNDE